MEVYDLLVLATESAMALAGFAGIIATFQFRAQERVRRADAVGLTIIVVFSLLAAVQCGLLLILHVLGVAETKIWMTGSILAAALNIYHFSRFLKNIDGSIRNSRLLTIMWILQLASVVIFVANMLNALNVVFHREPGPVLLSLAYSMFLAGYMFSRLLLIPIWRIVHKQNSADTPKTATSDSPEAL